MNDTFYPEIDPWPLQVISENLRENPMYLEDPECPYSDDVKRFFRDRVETASEVTLEDLDLEEETLGLYRDIKESRENFNTDDHAERNSYFRTATTLLEKLLVMQERATNVRQVSRFYEVVLGTLERYLEPDQITTFRNELKALSK